MKKPRALIPSEKTHEAVSGGLVVDLTGSWFQCTVWFGAVKGLRRVVKA